MNSKWRMCHPERNAVRREVEGSIRLVGALVALVMTFLTACTDYQAEFEESFGALEYIGEEYVSSDAGHHGGVSGAGDGVTSSAIPGTSAADNPSSSGEGTSVADNPSSSGTGTSAADIPGSSATDNVSSSGVNPASGSDTVVDGSSSSKTSSSSAKYSSSSALVPLSSYNPPRVAYGTLHDDRDEKDYRTIKLGSLTWMAQNLNYELPNSDSVYCYQNESMYCDHFGRLYVWSDAYNGACPEGWRLPDSLDWEDLFQYIKGKKEAGKMLKSNAGWSFYKTTQHDGNGEDYYGFSALPAGYWSYDGDHWWNSLTYSANFWTAKSKNSDSTYSVRFGHNTDSVRVDLNRTRDYAFSVRCVKGTLSSSSVTSSSSSFGSSGVYTDPRSDAGNQQQYQYVRYRGLVWMDQDLSYSVGATTHNGSTLYSWENAQNACPPNWRLPTIEEFNGSDGLEDKFKSSSLGGYFLMTAWHKKGYEGMYWLTTSSSSSDNYLYAVHFNINREFGTVVRVDKGVVDVFTESAAFAVRCVTEDLEDPKLRSSSSSVLFSMEQVFSNYGDSREYTTVTIGGYKWMAENLRYHADASLTNNATLKCRNSTSQLLNCDEDGIYYSYKNGAERIASLDQHASANGGRWTLPDSSEAAELLKAVGDDAGLLLSPEIGGTNESGFYVVPSGYHKAENEGATYRYISYQDDETCFWLWKDVGNSENANALCFFKNGGKGIVDRPKNFLYPIRLIWEPNH